MPGTGLKTENGGFYSEILFINMNFSVFIRNMQENTYMFAQLLCICLLNFRILDLESGSFLAGSSGKLQVAKNGVRVSSG